MKATAVAVIGLFLAAGCANVTKLASRAAGADGLNGVKVTSPSFTNGQMIPAKFTADGADISPPIAWAAGPEQTKSYVLIVEDPDAPRKEPFVHWIVYDLPPGPTQLPEGASTVIGKAPGGLTEGQNSKDLTGYVGPEPSPGKAHRYIFQVFAIDVPVTLAAGATKQQLVALMKGHVLMQGELTGMYKR